MRSSALALAACILAGAGSARAAPAGSPWGKDYFPDVPLVTQDGRVVRFYRDLVEGKHVVINFIFTRCTKSCPLETANLVRVQRRLGARVGRDVFLYSITLDAGHDTPEVLKEYAARFHAGEGWLFLGGRREDIDRIRARLGDRTPIANHSVGLVLGNDPAGQWTTLSAVDDPGFLATSIEEWMASDPNDHPPVRSYAEAPRQRSVPGEDLFRIRCAACHAVGGGEGVGPDLAGVTARRDRLWLERWIADPGKMLDEKDPLALELLARHRKLPMPALPLTGAEVTDLLSYIESLSAKVATDGGERPPVAR
ncbi:MAG TPA: SCO family protein [Anaeromyxobacter sp.]